VTLNPDAVAFWRHVMELAEEADAEWCEAHGVEYRPLDPATLGFLANKMAIRRGLPPWEVTT
jgi:hypothetical protein